MAGVSCMPRSLFAAPAPGHGPASALPHQDPATSPLPHPNVSSLWPKSSSSRMHSPTGLQALTSCPFRSLTTTRTKCMQILIRIDQC